MVVKRDGAKNVNYSYYALRPKWLAQRHSDNATEDCVVTAPESHWLSTRAAKKETK